MPFALGGVQKNFSRKHLFHHSTRSSWSLLNLIICLSMQAFAYSIRYAQYFLLRSNWVFSLVMRIYRSQCIDSVWRESPSSCTSAFGILSLNVTTMNHCHLTAHDLKELQSSLEVWGFHPSRGITFLLFVEAVGTQSNVQAHIWK